MPDAVPLTSRFRLGRAITPEQRSFLRAHGVSPTPAYHRVGEWLRGRAA